VGATAEATVQALARFRLSGGRGAALCQRLGDVSVVATRYVPEFVAGPGGAVTVEQDENGTTATARPAAGYRFVQWTQGGTQYSTANPLTVTDITSALTLTACFERLNTIPPSGDFLALIGASAVTTGGGFWNLTGAYSTLAHGAPLTLLMAHDARGRLTGTASYHAGALEDPPLVMPIRGTVRGTRRTVVLTFASRGSAAGKGVSVELAFALAVDPVNRRLTGPMTGAVTTAGVKHLISAVESPQTWNIAAPMDGTWSLMFADLSPGPASAVSGTALLTLSSGDAWHFRAKGRLGRDGLTSLVLSGLPGDLEASAIAISARIRTLEGTPECGIAEIVSCRGWGYGQTPTW
jgi:hypothetical protein